LRLVAFALPTFRVDAIRPAERLYQRGDRTVSLFFAIAATGWGLVMAVAPVLQVRRMLVRRSSADLSLGYFGILLPGFALWIGYGWTRADWALVVPNATAFVVSAVTVAVGLLLRRRQAVTRSSEAGG
jgi:MtN3 and saliva related transmembrane protein